jgi:hypothetical protein
MLLLSALGIYEMYVGKIQGDQIGRIFAQWPMVYNEQFFGKWKKLPIFFVLLFSLAKIVY